MSPTDDTGGRGLPEAGEGRSELDVIHLHEPMYRELAEPRDGYEPTPTWLVFFAMALLGWGGWYLGTYSAGFSSSVYEGGSPAAAAAPVKTAPPDPMAVGRRVFNNCMPCHQKEGQGVPGTYPPLAGSEWVLGAPEVTARIVLHGIQGAITVKGETYQQDMPPWGQLSDDQLAGVLTYIRGSWGNAASPVTAELVAAQREATKGQTQPWKAAQLQAFEAELGTKDPAPAPTVAAK